MKTKEKWRDISESKGYKISNQGTVLSKRNGKPMTPRVCRAGYFSIGLFICGKKTTRTIHRLVAQEFIPNPENKPCVNHIDANKLNNNVDNLEWCTYLENNIHARKFGLQQSNGRGSHGSKLSGHEVETYKQYYKSSQKGQGKYITKVETLTAQIELLTRCKYRDNTCMFSKTKCQGCVNKQQIEDIS